jgi:replicative DNA helicase Mcm
MPSRKERLEELAEHARKVIIDHPDFDRQAIYQALEEHIILAWGSAQQTRNDYLKSVAAMLKEELAKRDSETEAKIPKLDDNIGMLYGKPSSVVSKEKAFIEILRALLGPDNDSVEDKRLVSELVKSGKFDGESEAKKYIQKFNREGQIYERRPGFWAKS